MKKEHSYGAVIYKYENNELYFLIEYMKLGHVSIAKGHIEEGETEVQCALREIKEETNLDVNLTTDFRQTITYSPFKGISKDVTYFLATPKTDSARLRPQLIEVKYIRWLKAADAIKAVTYDNDRQVLKKALAYITSHKL